MIPLQVVLDGDNCWPDLQAGGFVRGELVAVARLPMGTVGGKSTVCFRVELEGGRVVLAETTLELMRAAMVAIVTRDQMEAENARQHN